VARVVLREEVARGVTIGHEKQAEKKEKKDIQ